jgi:TonB-dependent receptor
MLNKSVTIGAGARRGVRRLRAAALLATSALALVSAETARAQTAATAAAAQPATGGQPSAPQAGGSTDVGEVVVTGDVYANQKTIAAKRALSVVSDGVSANQIGELPEFGLGDALRAVPGISFVINNGRGEDQFMTIRGLNPDYDSTTIDGMVLPSTEETVRSVSFDVLPSILISQASVLKTWTVDQPTDAVGGVTALTTRSAFDHPGLFVSSHLDYAYWEDQRALHDNVPSGNADLVVSKTFGANDQFGALFLASYYQRDSSTLNTYTLPWSYYPSADVGSTAPGSATATSATLSPTSNINGDIAIPDRHRWYFYDNIRQRPGVFTRLDFNDHHMWRAHLSAGYFTFTNDENRYSQYLNRVGQPTMTTATAGSFAGGNAEVDYDRYVQLRELAYVDAGVGADFDAKTHLNLTANFGYGHYRQSTAEDQFATPASDQSLMAFDYNLTTNTAPLFTPLNMAAFMNPALYNQVYHLNAVDQSAAKLPQARIDYSHNFDADDTGFGYSVGAQHRDLNQVYSYWQYRLNPVGTAPTLAQIGALDASVPLYDGYGQTQLLVDPGAVDAYIFQNSTKYARNASDTLINTVNNYTLDERIDDAYAQAGYRTKQFYALLGLRYKYTRESIDNYLPEPFNSQTNFAETNTVSTYSKLLPSFNVSYTPITQVAIRGAITQTLARPEYSQLAENSSATVSGNLASETISNPHLAPRESTNYDISFEYYPAPGVLTSLALFDKQISNEIVTLTSTEDNVTIPGYATPVTLTITQPQNAGKSSVSGVEFDVVDSSFSFLPGPLKGLGMRGNVALMDMDAPDIRMSNGTMRHLPQLIASSRAVANAALFYNYGPVHAEISYTYTGKQPISFDTNNAANDQWWAASNIVDAQIQYQLTRNVDFRAQFKNLTDNRPQKVVGLTQQLNYSTLENGRAYFAGVAFHF